MEELRQAITSFIGWLQMPAVVCYALALLFGGYEMLFVGSERGTATAKKVFITATIAFIIIKAANVLANSLGDKISF
ncbi:hypothetical protein NNC19_21740 [Clostridium sp. SHJSY1]|uniref:hypothetical protein n=1 Tax=Clostridium sp. SHJSY1 TaxID=2942483 RepID=UPI0028769A7D|nr:hypothetical protein [Clostridium sp. SHJSY1]MDS0528313.1 hypothetical protein [Clostridium sp. SHJSY1]